MPTPRPTTRSRHHAVRGIGLLAAVVLAGCAAAGTRVTADLGYSYLPDSLGRIASGDRQLRVDIRQKPYAVPDAVFTDTVVDSMQGRTRGRVINFSIDPPNPYPRGNYRTVFLFNPPPESHPRRLCKEDFLNEVAPQGPLALAAGDAGVVQVEGALCNDNQALSWASGQSTQAPTVNSQGFDQLIAQMTLALFPAQNRNLDDNEDCRLPQPLC